MAAILTNGVLKIRTEPIFEPLLASPARYKGSGSTKARDVPPPMLRARHRTPDPPNQHNQLTVQHFSALQKNSEDKSTSGGPGPGLSFHMPLPLPVGAGGDRGARASDPQTAKLRA